MSIQILQAPFPFWPYMSKEKIKRVPQPQILRFLPLTKIIGTLPNPEITPAQCSERPMSSNNHVNYSRSGLLSQSSTTDPTRPKAKIYSEPLGSVNPPPKYRLYTFKEGKEIEMTPLVGQSFFLIGRDLALCTIQATHPSISKQHAVIQFRREFIQSELKSASSNLL